MEEGVTAAEDVLLQAIQAQENVQKNLTDLKARSCRNNICVYLMPEDTELNNLKGVLETFIKSEFSLIDTELERCHRALGPKPPQNARPHSTAIYFLEHSVKELAL